MIQYNPLSGCLTQHTKISRNFHPSLLYDQCGIELRREAPLRVNVCGETLLCQHLTFNSPLVLLFTL